MKSATSSPQGPPLGLLDPERGPNESGRFKRVDSQLSASSQSESGSFTGVDSPFTSNRDTHGTVDLQSSDVAVVWRRQQMNPNNRHTWPKNSEQKMALESVSSQMADPSSGELLSGELVANPPTQPSSPSKKSEHSQTPKQMPYQIMPQYFAGQRPIRQRRSLSDVKKLQRRQRQSTKHSLGGTALERVERARAIGGRDLLLYIFQFLDADTIIDSLLPIPNRIWRATLEHQTLWDILCRREGWEKHPRDWFVKKFVSLRNFMQAQLKHGKLRGHNGPILLLHSVQEKRYFSWTSLKWQSVDSKVLVSASPQNFRVWDVRTLGALREFDFNMLGVDWSNVHISENTVCLTRPQSAELLVVNLADNKVRRIETRHNSQITCCRLNVTGSRTAATGAMDGSVRVWELSTGRETAGFYGHRSRVWCVDIHPQGDMVLSGSEDKLARLWDVAEGGCTHILKGHQGAVRALRFDATSPDKVAVSGSADCTVKLWDLDSGTCIRTYQGHDSAVLCVEVSRFFIISGSRGGNVRLWDRESSRCLRVLPPVHRVTSDITSVCFLKSSQTSSFATGASDGTVIVWSFSHPTPSPVAQREAHEQEMKHSADKKRDKDKKLGKQKKEKALDKEKCLVM